MGTARRWIAGSFGMKMGSRDVARSDPKLSPSPSCFFRAEGTSPPGFSPLVSKFICLWRTQITFLHEGLGRQCLELVLYKHVAPASHWRTVKLVVLKCGGCYCGGSHRLCAAVFNGLMCRCVLGFHLRCTPLSWSAPLPCCAVLL